MYMLNHALFINHWNVKKYFGNKKKCFKNCKPYKLNKYEMKWFTNFKHCFSE